jgi:hypothetical protein
MPRFTKVWKMSRCLNLETASLSSNLSRAPTRVGVVGGGDMALENGKKFLKKHEPLWALPTLAYFMILAIGLDHDLSHSFTNCKSHKYSFLVILI